VITYAGMNPRVAELVYIAALCPDETETAQEQQEKFPKTDIFNHVEVAGGRVWLKPDAPKAFGGDLSAGKQRVVYATHFAPAADLSTPKLEGNAWRSKPPRTSSRPRIIRSIPNCSSARTRSAWVPQSWRSRAATSRCPRGPTKCSPQFASYCRSRRETRIDALYAPRRLGAAMDQESRPSPIRGPLLARLCGNAWVHVAVSARSSHGESWLKGQQMKWKAHLQAAASFIAFIVLAIPSSAIIRFRL